MKQYKLNSHSAYLDGEEMLDPPDCMRWKVLDESIWLNSKKSRLFGYKKVEKTRKNLGEIWENARDVLDRYNIG